MLHALSLDVFLNNLAVIRSSISDEEKALLHYYSTTQEHGL